MSVAEVEDYIPASRPGVDPYSVPLEDIDMSNGELFEAGEHHAWFERLRKEDPVHYCDKNPEIGPFWSITRYKDIMAVDTNHKVFSSEPSIALMNPAEEFTTPMFIAMDQPKHDVQRKAASPAVTPLRLSELDDLIRERTAEVLDNLPVGETFNWVQHVSIELTTRMLATLFDFPFEDRRKLTFWSDVTTSFMEMGISVEERREHLKECLMTFMAMFQERQREDNESQDFISLLANNPATKDMPPMELLGNLMLLIVGGNDTTRNSMSASIILMNQHPEEFAKLKANPDLLTSAVPEIIRYHTPLSYMRRTALEDIELGGKTIKKGDKVAMWYCSGNRDEDEIPGANEFSIDRANARHHMAFGYGIHRCLGNRVGEAQVRILWEEILKRFDRVELVGDPVRLRHSFVHGITDLPVIVHPK